MPVVYNIDIPGHAHNTPEIQTVFWYRSRADALIAARQEAGNAEMPDHDWYGDHVSVRRYTIPEGSGLNVIVWALNRGTTSFGVEIARFALGTGRQISDFEPEPESGQHERPNLRRDGVSRG